MREPLSAQYTLERFWSESRGILSILERSSSLEEARHALYTHVSEKLYEKYDAATVQLRVRLHIVQGCARAWHSLLTARSDERTGFSTIQALWDLSRRVPRPDLQPGFYAEMIHMAWGIQGRTEHLQLNTAETAGSFKGREAALRRSDELDRLWANVEAHMSRYDDGLMEETKQRRLARRSKIVAALNATDNQFDDWRWQVGHIARNSEELERMAVLLPLEQESIKLATTGRLPFGVTPYYASLFDDEPDLKRDHALRAQVIPPPEYVERMLEHRGDHECAFDFMLERDTSPIDLVTRRYPAIAIFKPYNTCPQICVYCQRNWEISEVMAPDAFASSEKIDAAIDYIKKHPALREILVTGGDPLGLTDDAILDILGRLAAIPHVELIRIGSRIPVTVPMRITPELAKRLGKLREPGRREICVVTHVEHSYEITPELLFAVDRLKRQGISVFNQLVYSFFVSRRFEACKLRMLLRRAGIEPYYTFVTKGKEETNAYRVPLARLLQEQKEEARLLPGLGRTDEAVYNVPGLGKNYLRAIQDRDLLAVMPDGARVYDFHSWEAGIVDRASYVGRDVPILHYLCRLEQIGENPDEYESIWYYY